MTPRGLIQIVQTPFFADGSIDFASLERLTASVLSEGASALTALGVTSEAAFLDERERGLVLSAIQSVNAGAVPLVIGITAAESGIVASRAAAAQAAGAAGVMIAPPHDPSHLVPHYAAAAEAAPGLPIILQDFPPVGYDRVDAATLAGVAAQVAAIEAVYHEDPPIPPRIAEVLRLAPDLAQIGGLGGLWLPWELRAGATAVMTGFAFPEFMAATVRAALAGDWIAADAAHAMALPLIAWEAQPVIGLAHRKAMLVERGIIETSTLRAAVPPTPNAAAEAAGLASALAHRRQAG